MAEKIRSAIKNKDKFTISEISKETGADPLAIHAFIANPGNHVQKNYRVEKEKKEQRQKGGPPNVYIRK